MGDELECVFCGQTARPVPFDGGGWFVECLNRRCDAAGPDADSREDAIAAWLGIRAEARREALREAMGALRAERDRWYRVATVDPPSEALRQLALAKVAGLTGGLEAIEALMPKEGT